MGINEFSSAGFGYEKDNSILHQVIKTDDYEATKQYIQNFEEKFEEKFTRKYLIKSFFKLAKLGFVFNSLIILS